MTYRPRPSTNNTCLSLAESGLLGARRRASSNNPEQTVDSED